MKFSIGDIILMKRTDEEGIVVGIINSEMIEVEVNGTHFPVFADEVEHPYLKWFTEKRKVKQANTRHIDDIPVEKTPKELGQNAVAGFHLSFLPVFKFDEFDDVVEKLKIYFMNQTPYYITLQYEFASYSGNSFSHKTVLQPFSHFYLHDIPFEEMHLQPRFSWLLEQVNVLSPAHPLKDTLRIKPKKLFEYIATIQQENEPMFCVKLADDFPCNIPLPAFDIESIRNKKNVDSLRNNLKGKKFSRPQQAIDLHVENLMDSTGGYSNYEILTLQLFVFKDALELAIKFQQTSLIVIHGIGKGKLKEEIHTILKSVSQVDFYQQNWNPKYGYGATEIFFRY